jgi:Replication protein
LGKRLNRYGTAKRHTLDVMRSLGVTRAKRMGISSPVAVVQCGDWLRFRDYYTVGKVKLVAASFCKKHLVCGLCAIRRASRLMASYLERFAAIRKDRPELRPYLVTLTVRNSHDLPEVLAHLLRSLRTLHRRRCRKNQPSVMHAVEGGVYAVELTHDAVTGWHPHVHAIWLADSDPGTFNLRTEWHQITGDSFICDVRAIHAEQQDSDDIDPHAGGFAECFKYAMKPAELGADLLEQSYPVLAGKRLIGSFGAFRGVPEPEELTDDLSGFDSLPYEEFLCRFLGGHYARNLPITGAGISLR